MLLVQTVFSSRFLRSPLQPLSTRSFDSVHRWLWWCQCRSIYGLTSSSSAKTAKEKTQIGPGFVPVVARTKTMLEIESEQKPFNNSPKPSSLRCLIDPMDMEMAQKRQKETDLLMNRYGSILPQALIRHRPPEFDGKIVGWTIGFFLAAAIGIHLLPEIGYPCLARDSITLVLRGVALALILQCGVHSGMITSQYGNTGQMRRYLSRQLKIRAITSAAFALPALLVLTLADTWVRDTCYIELILLSVLTALDYYVHRSKLAPQWYIHSMLLLRGVLVICLAITLISEQFQLNARPIEFKPSKEATT